MRMASQEFYFKQPFDIHEEYPIMKSILFFALIPVELILIFTYARIYGSLRAYILEILLIMAIVSLLLSNILINSIKDRPFISETITSYEQLDYEKRKSLYSFKNGASVIFLTALMPWILSFACIAIVCQIFPYCHD